jgi:hypothetical protein
LIAAACYRHATRAGGLALVNRPGIARGSGSGHLAPLGDGVSIHDFTFNGSQVVD